LHSCEEIAHLHRTCGAPQVQPSLPASCSGHGRVAAGCEYIGIGVALIVCGALRLLAGIAILRWGNQ